MKMKGVMKDGRCDFACRLSSDFSTYHPPTDTNPEGQQRLPITTTTITTTMVAATIHIPHGSPFRHTHVHSPFTTRIITYYEEDAKHLFSSFLSSTIPHGHQPVYIAICFIRFGFFGFGVQGKGRAKSPCILHHTHNVFLARLLKGL